MVIADKYRLERVIGEGGMGAVWLARNATLHVDVAIKLIRREIASLEAAERLLQEARAAARLDHPSIVRVHDFGETASGDPFIVMELLNGDSLADVIARKGRLPAAQAVQILLPIASALAAAHDKGIVHRDLKPDNILLVASESGDITPKLLDFGIAKLQHDVIESESAHDDGEAARNVARKLTMVGRLVGSPQYMAPEQARGEADVDGRADVWALAIVLYEAITGARPFGGDDDVEKLLVAILAERPKSLAAHGLDEEGLWRILDKGLAKRREARWPGAREMAGALAQWLSAHDVDHDITGKSLHAYALDKRESESIRPGGLVTSDPLGVRATPVLTGIDAVELDAAARRIGQGRRTRVALGMIFLTLAAVIAAVVLTTSHLGSLPSDAPAPAASAPQIAPQVPDDEPAVAPPDHDLDAPEPAESGPSPVEAHERRVRPQPWRPRPPRKPLEPRPAAPPPKSSPPADDLPLPDKANF